MPELPAPPPSPTPAPSPGTASSPPTYEIQVLGIELWGRHGVFEEERVEGRHFSIDATVEVLRSDRLGTDRLEGTIDYRKLADLIVEIGNGPSLHLIETLADKIAAGCLAFDRVVRAKVTVRKRASGVPGNPKWVAVRVTRLRGAP